MVLLGQMWYVTVSACCIATPEVHERGSFQILPRHTQAVPSLAQKRFQLLIAGLHFLSSYHSSRNNIPEETGSMKKGDKVFTVTMSFSSKINS